MTDNFDNFVYREDNVLYIRLDSLNIIKRIGEIDVTNKTLTVYRNYDSHLLKLNNSFGFNTYVLEDAPKDYVIILKTNRKEVFKIPIRDILKLGEEITFKKSGYETQTFFPVDKLSKYKI